MKDLQNTIEKYIWKLLDNSSPMRPIWNIELVRSGKTNKWNYIDGCMIASVLSLYEETQNSSLLEYADKYMAFFVSENGDIESYTKNEQNLDDVCSGKNLIILYRLTGKRKYLLSANNIRMQLNTQPRTLSGNFWHKKIYPWQIWLDGLYMAMPFYALYDKTFSNQYLFSDVIKQFLNVEKLMKDKETGLYYHAYDERRNMYWSDNNTGCSKSFWLRSTGWFLLSLVDTVEIIRESVNCEYSELIRILNNLALAVSQYQDSSGMFWQIIDFPNDKGNYLETSGTALVAYSMLKGARLGLLPATFSEIGAKAFYGITERYLHYDQNGTINLGGICLSAGLGGNRHRDGSAEYYFSEPIVENDAKGIGPFIMCYKEILIKQYS